MGTRGGQLGNQNARREHTRLAVSFSGVTLELAYEWLAEQGETNPTSERVKKFIVEKFDEYATGVVANKMNDIWRIFEVLVQTNGTVNHNNLTSCIQCGEGIFTNPGQWKHTKNCLFWRMRLLLDDRYYQRNSVENLNLRAKVLYLETEKLKQTDVNFAEWAKQIFI